jgi:hypothetical protein
VAEGGSDEAEIGGNADLRQGKEAIGSINFNPADRSSALSDSTPSSA